MHIETVSLREGSDAWKRNDKDAEVCLRLAVLEIRILHSMKVRITVLITHVLGIVKEARFIWFGHEQRNYCI